VLGRSVGYIAARLRQHSSRGFSLLEVHDQDFYSLLDQYVFRNGATSSTEGLYFCVGVTFVAPQFQHQYIRMSLRPGHYGHCESSKSESELVTLQLAVCRQSIRIGPKTIETLDQQFFSIQSLRSQSLCNTLSDERVGLSFTIAVGLPQHNHSQVQIPWYS
jgi:hypothetical protein